MPGGGAVVADDRLQPRQPFAVVAAAVAVAGGDPRIERIGDAEIFQNRFRPPEALAVGFGPVEGGVAVGKVLGVDLDDDLVDSEARRQLGQLGQQFLKTPRRQGPPQRVPGGGRMRFHRHTA